jgi:hypothetical protein
MLFIWEEDLDNFSTQLNFACQMVYKAFLFPVVNSLLIVDV